MAMTPNIPLVSWSPDADPTQPGIVSYVKNVVPTRRGFTSEQTGVAVSGASLGGKCYGAKTVSIGDVSDTRLTLFATAGDLFVWNGTTLTNRSRSGSSYTLVTFPGTGWRFDQFGEYTLAIQRDNKLQASSNIGTTDFSDVSAAPSAYTMCVASGFVMAANTYDLPGTNSYRYADAWWCSALRDHTGWAPDLATQCDRGRLRETPGAIIRLLSYGPDVLAFKRKSIIRGRYVNRAADGIIWAWQTITDEVGIVGHDAVTIVDGAVYFMSERGPFVFDGAALRPIKSFPHVWFTRAIAYDLTRNLDRLTQAVYDPIRKVVRWHFTRSSSVADELTAPWTGGCLTYHPDTDRWGYSEHRSEWALNVPSGSAYLPEAGGPAWPAIPATGPYLARDAAAYVDASTHQLMVYEGAPDEAIVETGDVGDDELYTVLTRSRLRFLRAPTDCVGFHFHRTNLGDAMTMGDSDSRVDGKFDFSHSARWHRLRFTVRGDFEINGMQVEAKSAGTR